MVVGEAEVCEVSYDPEVPCVAMVWKGYFTSPRFREANERVLAMIQETRATKLLGDVTNFKLIGAEDQRWLNDDWIPRTIKAGLRYVALVQPVFYFNQVAVQTVAQRIDPETLVVSHFDSAQAARRWLWGAHRYPGADAGEPG